MLACVALSSRDAITHASEAHAFAADHEILNDGGVEALPGMINVALDWHAAA